MRDCLKSTMKMDMWWSWFSK